MGEDMPLSVSRSFMYSDGNNTIKDKDLEGSGTHRGILQKIFPTGFKAESKHFIVLAWPVVLTQACSIFLNPISLMLVGHLGTTELDAAALSLSLLGMTCLSTGAGLTTSCDTLFSQAFGSNNKHRLGMYLQRTTYVITLAVFPVWAVHLNTESILLGLGQNPDVSRLAGQYIQSFMPGVPFCFWYLLMTKYLQNQDIVKPSIIIGIVGNLLNVLVQYIGIYQLGLGIVGSAAGQAIAYAAMCIMTVCYIFCSNVRGETWRGWTWESLEEWGVVGKLSFAGFVMLAIEWWAYEVGIFFNGILGKLQLAATSIAFQLNFMQYVIPTGFGLANSIRVGQNLGAANPNGAKTASRVGQTLMGIACVVQIVMTLALRNVLPYLFTNEKDVADLATNLIIIMNAVILTDAICAVSGGTLRGAGRQATGAIIHIIGYILITIPMAWLLMFNAGLGVYGFWWAFITGAGVCGIIYLTLIWRLNWQHEVSKMSKRLRLDKTYQQSEMIDSTSDKKYLIPKNEANKKKTEDEYELPPDHTQRFKWLVIKRILLITFMAMIFVVGLILRVLYPHPVPAEIVDISNSTFTNMTSIQNFTVGSISYSLS